MKSSARFKFLPQHETLRTIALMRLIALAGQLLVVAGAQFWLGIDLWLPPLFAVMLLLATFNGWTWRRMQHPRPAGEIELFIQVLADMAALSALLYFSGGATNPFVSFYLPALALAAAILPWRLAFALALFSLACYSLMAVFYIPLHIMDPERAVTYHLSGMWANFALSAALITWFIARLSQALRERDVQLAAAREQHLHSERIVALGTQAASAAHEMGTPLATVAVIAGELQHEAGRNAALAAYRDDLRLIEAQIALCKAALDRMGMQAGSACDNAVPAAEWLQQFIEEWRLRHPAAQLHLSLQFSTAQFADAPAISQILLSLLDNAAQAAAGSGVPIGLSFAAEQGNAIIRVKDKGAGIAPELLNRLGYEPVQSSTNGKGIGLMLAFATARQIGATLELRSRRQKGTMAILTIPLA